MSADKHTIGSGPGTNPDRPRRHRYGDSLDSDIRAAIRTSRGYATSTNTMFRNDSGRTLEDTIRMSAKRHRTGPDSERC